MWGAVPEKATLEEMADIVQDCADREFASIKFHEGLHPNMPPDQKAYRNILALESAAHVLRAMGTYPDDSRVFVAGLLKRHADGR